MSNRLFLSLGSNIEPRNIFLKMAVSLLSEKFTFVKVSPVYETDPVDFVSSLTFLNICAEYLTDIDDPFKVLDILEEIESSLERDLTQKGKKMDRTIDIDILFFGDIEVSSERLTIPHPRMFERLFVLKPLLDILELSSDYINKYSLIERASEIKGQQIKKVGEIEL